jgi:hypothetical protein
MTEFNTNDIVFVENIGYGTLTTPINLSKSLPIKKQITAG